MARNILSKILLAAAVLSSANAYFLFAMNDVITTERIDPIVNPGKVSGHVHTVIGGSNFRVSTNTSYLRQSGCTSSPIKEDKSNYWAPTLYFQWANGSFTSVNGNPVIYYLYSDTPGVTTVFPDDFRMLSGTPTLRSYNASSYAQQAVTFLCLDFSGTTTKFNQLPAQKCPSGIRAQINFPSCWDGVNTDSADHKSHVAFLSGGPDSGTCSDPKYPKTLPRIFMEMYLDTASFDQYRDQAMNPDQPFVYSMGDPTGYGYHADFIFGWDSGVLDQVVNKCQCTSAAFGDPTCCSNEGYFDFVQGGTCRITKGVDEITTGTIPSLPGNNPVVPLNGVAANLVSPVTPPLIEPVYYYTGDSPTQTGTPVGSPVTASGGTTPTSVAVGTTSVAATSTKGAQTSSTKGAQSQTSSMKGAQTSNTKGAQSQTTSTKGYQTSVKGATSTSVAEGTPASSSKGKATSTKGAQSTVKGATSTSQAGSAPTSGSGSPGSNAPGGYGYGTPANGGSGYGSGSGSNSGASSSSKGTQTTVKGATATSEANSAPTSGSGSPSSPGGYGTPANGSGSGYGSNSGASSSSSSSSSSSGSKSCHKKKTKRRALHDSVRRRFSEDDF